MFNVKFSGFKTKDQAEAFANWFEGHGEQPAAEVFSTWKQQGDTDFSCVLTDVPKTYPLKWEGDSLSVTVQVHA